MCAALTDLAAEDLDWAVGGLRRYVNHRHVDAAFLRMLDSSNTPGELIEPDDPAYGQQVFDALLSALEKRIAARLRARPHEKADARTKALIGRHIPACGAMLQALEDLAIGYEVIRLTIDGKDCLYGSDGHA